MKKSLILVSLVILLKPAFPVLDYFVNYQYVSKVLCVNKARPQMHCNGKCHLMKELAKASEKETPATPDKKAQRSQTEVLFFLEPQEFGPAFSLLVSIRKTNSACANLYGYLDEKGLFRPPAFPV